MSQNTTIPVRLNYIVTVPITADLFLRGQLSFMRRRGWEVSIISSPGSQLEECGQREEVKTVALPMSRTIAPLRDLQALWNLYRTIKQDGPMIVNASTPKAGLLGTLAARMAGVPVRIYLVRGLRLETTSGMGRKLLTHMERMAARCATHVVCNSMSLQQQYIDNNLAPAEKISIVGHGTSNGLDVMRFSPTSERQLEAQALRLKFGIPPNAKLIGFVGRLTRDKGIVDLADAYQTLSRNNPNLYLLLVGVYEDGDPIPSETIAYLQSHPRVIFAGFVEDTAPYYALMEVLAFPSYREGFPNAPLEAAAAKKPTVGYASTGVVDAVENGITGLLVPTGDRVALESSLQRILTDKDLLISLGEQAVKRVHERFSQEVLWSAWATFYSNCFNAKCDPSQAIATLHRDA